MNCRKTSSIHECLANAAATHTYTHIVAQTHVYIGINTHTWIQQPYMQKLHEITKFLCFAYPNECVYVCAQRWIPNGVANCSCSAHTNKQQLLARNICDGGHTRGSQRANKHTYIHIHADIQPCLQVHTYTYINIYICLHGESAKMQLTASQQQSEIWRWRWLMLLWFERCCHLPRAVGRLWSMNRSKIICKG